jgi:polyisoprenoid-binding protein YceI
VDDRQRRHHDELPTEQFFPDGGPLHAAQLWVNHPPALKFTTPPYQAIASESLKLLTTPGGGALIRLIAGSIGGTTLGFSPNRFPQQQLTPLPAFEKGGVMAPIVTSKNVPIDQLIGEWRLDTKASEIRIAHKTLWGLVEIKGHFKTFRGGGHVNADGQVAGSITIDVASIDTKNQKRDKHLRSEEFFDVQQFPSITLHVSDVAIRDNAAQVRSSLDIKGIHEPLTFTGHVEEVTVNTVTLTATFTVDRDRFGMSWNKAGMMKGLTTVTVRTVFHHASG